MASGITMCAPACPGQARRTAAASPSGRAPPHNRGTHRVGVAGRSRQPRGPWSGASSSVIHVVVNDGQGKGSPMACCPGTTERGRAFVAELHDDGRMTLTITAFARRSCCWHGWPVRSCRAVQAWATRRCVTALEACQRNDDDVRMCHCCALTARWVAAAIDMSRPVAAVSTCSAGRWSGYWYAVKTVATSEDGWPFAVVATAGCMPTSTVRSIR